MVDYMRLTPGEQQVLQDSHAEAQRQQERACEDCEEACVLQREGVNCDALDEKDKEIAELQGLNATLQGQYEAEKKRADSAKVPDKHTSWFTGHCKECGFNVVVTQPDNDAHPYDDYWWYCSNKPCKHHAHGEHTGDLETPAWVELDRDK